MKEIEKRLLATQLAEGAGEPTLTICSRMRIDAGLWWRKTRLWVCVTDTELILLSVARRKYIERVSFADCRESRYCHESGELVLAPVETLRFGRIRMSPRDALAVLKQMGDTVESKEEESAKE